MLRGEAEKLKNGLRIGSMDKFISLVYPQAATLFDYFPPEDSLLFFSEGNKLKERVRTTLWQWGEDLKSYLAEGLLCKGLDQYSQDWEYALGKAEDYDFFLRRSLSYRNLIDPETKFMRGRDSEGRWRTPLPR